MSIYAPPARPTTVPTGSPPQPPPRAHRRRKGRGTLLAAAGAVIVSAIAAAVSAAALATPAKVPVHTVIVSATFTAEQIGAAKKQACDAWAIASEVLAQAATAVADAPRGWTDPVKQQALAAEARSTLVETAYLRSNIRPETPAELRKPLDDYLVATSDQEDATTHMRGHARNDAIDRVNDATERANVVCGIS